MVKLLILYFSGTGNTAYIASYLAARLRGIQARVQVGSIEQLPAEEVCRHDIIVFGFPVHGYDSPSFFQHYLDQIPAVTEKGAYVFCTSGGFPGNASYHNLKRLICKGFIPLGSASIGMPGSDGLLFMEKDSMLVRLALKKNFDRIKTADRLLDNIKRTIEGLSGGKLLEDYRISLPYSLSGLGFEGLSRLISFFFDSSLKNGFSIDNRCNRCGICLEICPAGNIAWGNNGVVFLAKCILCLRCIHQCPEEAIQIGSATVNKFRWKGPKGDFSPAVEKPGQPGS